MKNKIKAFSEIYIKDPTRTVILPKSKGNNNVASTFSYSPTFDLNIYPIILI